MEEQLYKLNLNSLKRQIDEQISDILVRASHVIVFSFDLTTTEKKNKNKNKWEKKEIEGTLFLVQKSQKPYFGLVVLNRLNTENHITMIQSTPDHQFKYYVQEPFLVYSSNNDKVYGLWFHSGQELDSFHKMLMSVVPSSSYCPRDTSSSSSSGADLKILENRLKTILMGSPSSSSYLNSVDQPAPSKGPEVNLLALIQGNQQSLQQNPEWAINSAIDRIISIQQQLQQQQQRKVSVPLPFLPSTTTSTSTPLKTIRPAFNEVPIGVLRSTLVSSQSVPQMQQQETITTTAAAAAANLLSKQEFIGELLKLLSTDETLQDALYSGYMKRRG